jgi:HAE1 family hydrophobic/amphiphilic exporter-1
MMLSDDLFSRLWRSTWRKAFGFPATIGLELGEATLRRIGSGASGKKKGGWTESQRLSAVGCAKGALSLARRTIGLAGGLVIVFVSVAVGQQVVQPPAKSPTPAVSAQQTITVPAIAVDYKADTRSPLPSLTRVGVDTTDQQPLSLSEAIALALKNNKDIEVARDNVKIAEYDLITARGSYDPRLTAQNYFERIETPATSVLSGASRLETDDITGTARFEGLTPKYGGSYHIDFSSVRLNSNSVFNVLNPSYPTALTFSYVQPLVRGLRFDLPRRQIEVARKNLSLTDAQFRQRAIEVITNVQRSYWDLVFALRNLQIQRDSLTDAREQLAHNRRMVTEGSLAPIDVVAAETQVANFEQAEFSALEDVTRTENNLKNMIAENQQARLWNLSIIPSDQVDLTVPQVALPDALKSAKENRQELKQSDLAREINLLDQKLYRDQTKPEIDIVGSYGMTGNAGTQVTTPNPLTTSSDQLRARVNELSTLSGLQPLPTPPTVTILPDLFGGYFQSLSNLGSNQFNNFRVGVSISLPLHNRTAEGLLGHSLVEGERIATQREQLEQLIQVEVRNALQSLSTTEARLRSAAVARSTAEQQYESEKRKLDAGQSTVFLVLERQTALAVARGNELRAQTDLNKAIAELQRATGNSLTANNVTVTAH